VEDTGLFITFNLLRFTFIMLALPSTKPTIALFPGHTTLSRTAASTYPRISPDRLGSRAERGQIIVNQGESK
jgi:hypothetical protein